MSHPNKFTLITCNNILDHFCTNSKNIAMIKIVMDGLNPTSLEIEQYFNDCMDYLLANQLIRRTTSRMYAVTNTGMTFYQNGGFKI